MSIIPAPSRPAAAAAAQLFPEAPAVRPEQMSDEELVAAARSVDPGEAAFFLDVLYRRYYTKVTYWCLSVCGDRETARDVAQEVFLRVHTKLDSFRLESRFSTWLYTVTRRVAINQGKAARVREMAPLEDEPADAALPADRRLHRKQAAERLHRMMDRFLTGREAEVLRLHFVDGLTLDAVSDRLRLGNKSGARAYLVSAKRKMRRVQSAA